MIENPPVLTIRRNVTRPAADLIDALAGTPTGFLVDCMGGRGGLDYRIKPLRAPGTAPAGFTGPAVTCHTGPDNNLAVFGALDLARPGDVIVIATDGFTGSAVIGDNMVGMARNKGVAAIVTDGLARDAEGILGYGLPVYCRGVTPNSAARNGPGTVGLPITVERVVVESGDVLVGDGDGAVVIPSHIVEAVIGRLAAVREAETALGDKIRGGLALPEFVGPLLASDKVRYVD